MLKQAVPGNPGLVNVRHWIGMKFRNSIHLAKVHTETYWPVQHGHKHNTVLPVTVWLLYYSLHCHFPRFVLNHFSFMLKQETVLVAHNHTGRSLNVEIWASGKGRKLFQWWHDYGLSSSGIRVGSDIFELSSNNSLGHHCLHCLRRGSWQICLSVHVHLQNLKSASLCDPSVWPQRTHATWRITLSETWEAIWGLFVLVELMILLLQFG